MKTVKLVDLAKVIRSKNAGPDKITFDIIFNSRENYEAVKASKALTPETVTKLFNVPMERLSDFVEFDPACAIKFTFYRTSPSGSPGDGDVFGCQQYAPLMDVEIPIQE
ncbi:MAG: DUF4387 domain-containing protein [Bacillota bacterium]|nr:DUF4387 domain-containing protein [Candidatus Fermentithermobacillaceae bacterium]HOA71386.1 DUF4387 domain-containing protein [Bacillota bacterium]HOP70439.1 DUF4387 domain-containing protein [Bacillota bacterium]HPT35938.1 DUF4387 domain-containing protein [Bacillota bacterium]HPZ86046.1 DUF4387 domain-containing protein [Bacillota bacterium]